ncbi:MAG: LacI family DNA-binding transcriptional regulator [Actinomycetota bacterium]|nr:LacI family DNA-binding transcriptional regulator [Actinomycetota bacterium]
MRPKLAEVAQLADVSEATVSRVLNGRPGVAETTRRRVLDVMGDLGYRDVPSRSASSGVVGIITPELENPVFALFAQSLQSHLASRGMLPVVCTATSETVNEQDYLEHFLSSRAAGVVLINGRYAQPEIGYDPYVALRDQGLPLVLVNGIHDPSPLPAVAVDLKAATAAAVRHLVTLGHRRIGLLIGPIRYSTSLDMIEGCRTAAERLAVECGEDTISESVFTFEGGRAGSAQLLEAGVTGIIAANDLMAAGAIDAVRAWGGNVPDDVSVIGFDGTPAMSYSSPRLTTLRQPVDRMSAAATALLADAMDGNGVSQTQVFAPELVVGHSTGPARA